MTTYQKRENLEKRYYREIKKGNYEKAKEIMKKIVDLDVQMSNKKLNNKNWK